MLSTVEEYEITSQSEEKKRKGCQKLMLPDTASIPRRLLEDPDISGDAKVHYGCIAQLTLIDGYCWATDAQLAEQQNFSIKTIEKWNTLLERKGYIRRETKNVLCPADKVSFKWIRKRKIFINKRVMFSNSSFETRLKEGTDEPLKNEGSIKEKIRKEETHPNPLFLAKDRERARSSECVFFSSDKMKKIPENLQLKLIGEFSEEDLERATAMYESHTRYIERPYSWLCSCIREKWQRPPDKFAADHANKKILKEIFSKLDGSILHGYAVTTGPGYIEFCSGGQCVPRVFNTHEINFEKSVRDYIHMIQHASINAGGV